MTACGWHLPGWMFRGVCEQLLHRARWQLKEKVGAQEKKVPGGMFLSPGRSCQIRDGLGGRAGVGTAGQDQTLTIGLVSFVEGLMIDID